MGFVHIIEFNASRMDEIKALDQEWMAATEGKRTVLRQLICADRDNPGRYVAVLEFDSHEAATVNAELPETLAYAERFFELCDTHVHAQNLDVLDTYIADTYAADS